MTRKFKKLAQSDIETITKAGYHGDGLGLWLRVAPGGAKSWAFRYRGSAPGNRDGGKQREMSLGPCHTVGLDEARRLATEARLMRLNGVDPIDERHKRQAAAKLEAAKQTTFNDAATTYISTQSPAWKNAKHIDQWTNTLTTYAGPVFGLKPVANIDTDDVLACLKPIWTSKNETASRLRGRIESILDYARHQGWRTGDNPARWSGNLEHSLANISRVGRIKHFEALPYAKASDFVLTLKRQGGIAAQCLQFAILTAARSGEARGATWAEIDFDTGLWVVPADRMKAKREHRVPLSADVVALLKPLHEIRTGDLIFPGRKARSALSDMSLTAVLRRMGQAEITVHGFRSCFRDWAAETTEYAGDLVELALAHSIGNKVEAAYRRGDQIEKRRKLMQEWADFLSTAERAEAAKKLGAAVLTRIR